MNSSAKNIFYRVFALSVITTSIYAILLIPSCRLQLLAANSNPAIAMNKHVISIGILIYILLLDYRVLSILLITFPYRMRIFNGFLKKLLLRDLKYVVIPVLLVSIIIFIGYTYILYSSIKPDVFIYIYYSATTTIIMGILSIYIYVFGLPATLIKGFRNRLLIGLTASIISGIASFMLTILSIAIPYYIWVCRASDYSIKVVNPNTGIFEASLSISLTKIMADIVGYMMYSYLLYSLLRKFNPQQVKHA